MKVALIDDDKAEGLILKKLLKGHDVIYYPTYKKYLESSKKHHVRIFDMNMPEYNIEFFKKITLKEKCLTYLFTGGNVDFLLDSAKQEFFDAGINEILNKNDDRERLKRYINLYALENTA